MGRGRESVILTEFVNNTGNVAKEYRVLSDENGGRGSLKVKSAPTVWDATGVVREIEFSEVGNYFNELALRHDTCVVFGVCKDAEIGEEFQIGLAGEEGDGRVSRTGKYFQYANSDHVSLMYLDFDSDVSDTVGDVRQEFLQDLDLLLSECLIGETAVERDGFARWSRPSSSGSVAIDGKVGNGLHVYFPVKNAKPELVLLLHKWCWLRGGWASAGTGAGRGHKITKNGRVLAESLIDPAVRGAERICYTSDALILEEPEDRADGTIGVERVDRVCDYKPGGVIDCETALMVLREATVDYEHEWSIYKSRVEKSDEVKAVVEAWTADQVARRIEGGMSSRDAKKAVRVLLDDVVLSSDNLTKTDGGSVPVVDVLLNRDDWHGVDKFCDPVKQNVGRNVGKIFVMEDSGKVMLHSFSHGGVRYWLKWAYDDLVDWVEICDLDELEDWFALHICNSELSKVQEEKLVKLAAKRMEVGVVAVRGEVKDVRGSVSVNTEQETGSAGSDESEPVGSGLPYIPVAEDATHADIIDDYLRQVSEGSGECRGFGNGLYVWKDGGTVWEKHSAGYINKRLRRLYNHVNRCAVVQHYDILAKAIIADEAVNVDSWSGSFGIPCSDKFWLVDADGVRGVEYTKELGCRFKLGFKPDFEMRTPLFDKVIANVENPVLFQQLFGLALSGYLQQMQKVFVMQGKGGSGKGTAIEVMSAMLPRDRVTNVSLSKMNEEKYRMPLVDSVVNIVPELDKGGKKLQLAGLKMLTGGDLMSGWVLYKGQVFFKPTCSQVISMNDWAPLESSGSEVKRRLGHTIVRFERRNEDQIDNLASQIIKHELPGILAWAIEGIRMYFEFGLEDSLSVKLFGDWTNSFDPVSLFFDEYCSFEPRATVARSQLWKSFKTFCEDSAYYLMKKGEFFAEVEKVRTVERFRQHGEYLYRGVKLGGK